MEKAILGLSGEGENATHSLSLSPLVRGKGKREQTSESEFHEIIEVVMRLVKK